MCSETRLVDWTCCCVQWGLSQPTCALAHLVAVEQQVSIAAHSPGPLGGVVLPDGCVVVQAEGQVVVDQILTRHLQPQQKIQLLKGIKRTKILEIKTWHLCWG